MYKYFKQVLCLFLVGLSLIYLAACSGTSTLPKANKNPSNIDEFDRYLQKRNKAWIGKKAPHFEGQTLLKNTLRLDELRGKIVLLNFWFVDCPPCITEIESLNMLQEKYKKKGVVVLSIARDAAAELHKVKEKYGIAYAILPSGEKIADTYGVTVYPTSVLINSQGNIEKIFTGGSDFDATHTYFTIQPHIEQLLRTQK